MFGVGKAPSLGGYRDSDEASKERPEYSLLLKLGGEQTRSGSVARFVSSSPGSGSGLRFSVVAIRKLLFPSRSC